MFSQSVSIDLLMSFTAIYLTAIILFSTEHLKLTSLAQTKRLNSLIGAALFITASTTSITASLIAYRIYSLSRSDPLNRAKKTFNKLVDVLIQSAAAYAIISLFYAVETVVPQSTGDIFILSAMGDYLFYTFPIVAVRFFIFVHAIEC